MDYSFFKIKLSLRFDLLFEIINGLLPGIVLRHSSHDREENRRRRRSMEEEETSRGTDERMMEKMYNAKKWFGLLAALILVLFCAVATAEGRITVTGSGEVRVSADTAVISLGVSARDPEVLTAQQKANEAVAAIRKALMKSGVREEDINTEFINIYATYDYKEGQEQLTAYNATSTLAIRVTDMESVGTLIDAAFAAGANTLNGISFSASDTSEAEAEAMKAAVENAKKKADILAEAAGLKIAGIELVSEGGVYSYQNDVGNVYSRATGMDVGAKEESGGTVVQSAKLIVSATVSITFLTE